MDPRTEYERRLSARREALAALERRDLWIANTRLGIFIAAGVLGVLAWISEGVSAWWLLPPAVAFVALVVFHDVVLRAIAQARAAVTFYEVALSRLDGTWPGRGVQRTDYVDADHPYAADLDLFGRGSLFDLLCTARTRAGEETLAAWLARGAGATEVVERQGAVDELRERLDLREDMALLGGNVRAEVHPDILIGWGEAPASFPEGFGAVRVLAMLLTAAAVASAAAWPLFDVGPVPLIAVIALELGLYRVLRGRVHAVTAAIQGPREELNVLATVFARLERETFAHPRTMALKAELGADGIAAAAQIRRLERLVTWLDAQRNQFFIPIAVVTNWSVHFAFAIETWRRRCGPLIGRWLSALGELEALNALSTFAFDNPADPFPEVVAHGNGVGPRYQGDDLGHPLLPRDRAVRNSVDLGTVTQVLVVSGSNMSGKSTLLRTVGINAVLALAGGPVRATRLSMTPLQLGATLRVLDSLSEGTSRFYAEIRRLRQLMELTREPPPLLFLLDEILHGTNSHDRQIGAEAVVEGLLGAGAIGLVTTHDLALARTADALAPRGKNVHFEDELVDGRLHFDYRLREGVVTKSNALDLMRSIGLPV